MKTTLSNPNKIRILLADDHRIVRMGLAAVLETEHDLHVVAEADDGWHAVESFREHRPDVVIMDLRMPGMSGMDALHMIRTEDQDARIIVLSTYDGDIDIAHALKAGAQGYMLKSTPPVELIQAIRTVYSGARFIPADVARRLAENALAEPLTSRELDVLQLVVKGRSNKEIGSALNLTEGTVKIHMHHLFAKLVVSDRTQASIKALRRGLVHLD